MDVTSSTLNTMHPTDYQTLTEDPSRAKTTEEIQQDSVKQAQVQKAQAEETKKIESDNKKEEIQQELTALAAQLNDEIAPLSNDIRFGFNDKIGQLMVNVVDAKTGEVIRQFPTEEAIEIMTKMKELIGMLFDKKG